MSVAEYDAEASSRLPRERGTQTGRPANSALISNSEAGGKESDRAFFERTLKMVDLYGSAGGRPTRIIVQSWYAYPRTIVPEDEPYSMTALVKAVIERSERQAGGARHR